MNLVANSESVQATNDASIVSKCSTVKKEYIQDDFIEFFVNKTKNRAPLIHLGYFTRMSVIEEMIQLLFKLLSSEQKVISCGAGFDTLYWRLRQSHKNSNWTLMEVDFPNVISRKLALIKASSELHSYVDIPNNWNLGDSAVQLNNNYFMIGCDLSDLRLLEMHLRFCSDFHLPTVFISECAVTYMEKNASDALIAWISAHFRNTAIINYEQIQPQDGYGRVMMNHFDSLRSPLRSVTSYPSCRNHRERYFQQGFASSYSIDEWSLFQKLLTPVEVDSALEREQFDEFEEFHSKCLHYVIALAGNGKLENWWQSVGLKSTGVSLDVDVNVLDYKLLQWCPQLYCHSCSSKKSDIFLYGGVNSAGKSSAVYKIQKIGDTLITSLCELEDHSPAYNAVHGSAVIATLNGLDYTVYYGGRTSPSQVWLNGQVLVLDEWGRKVEFFNETYIKPTPRYRSPLVLFSKTECVVTFVMFGGRASDLSVKLDDLWQLELSVSPPCLIWREIVASSSSKPAARMSHSLTASQHGIYLSCGLDSSDYNALSDIWKLDVPTESWQKLTVAGAVSARYGHTSHIVGDRLLLVGGVSTLPGTLPLVDVISLTSNIVQNFTVQIPPPTVFLPFNHTSIVLAEDELLILGGGGQCFSFGTHFNSSCLSIPLHQSHAEQLRRNSEE